MPEVIETAGHRLTVYDLSQRVSNRTSNFEPNPHHIEYFDPKQTAQLYEKMLGLAAALWPGGQFCSVETVTASTHAGTHVDAPIHYGPPDDGRPIGIDEVPLRWCVGDGVRLDFRHKHAGEGIARVDVERELDRIGHRLRPFDVVLIWTGTDRLFTERGYENEHAGLRRDATEFMVDQGVRLIGIDAWGVDRPFDVMAREAARGDRAQLWESHVLGRTKPYSQIEKLCNLDQLPRDDGFTVFALPIRLDQRAPAGQESSRSSGTERRPPAQTLDFV
jgi:kynurenine formamidase